MTIKVNAEEDGTKVIAAIHDYLDKVKTEIAVGCNKLDKSQHLRFIMNTIDQHLGDLKGRMDK